jgi:HEAT repeat protein
MAYVSSYQQQQEPRDYRERLPVMPRPAASASTPPPGAQVRVVTPEELHALGMTLLATTNIERIREDPTKTETDELQYFAATMGHSRALTAEEMIRVCKASFANSQKTPSEQWLALRNTTFPFSPLSDEERQAIADNLDRIIEYASHLGLLVVTIYIALKLNQKVKEATQIIIDSKGGDVAVGGSTIDKRSGWTHIGSMEYANPQLVPPNQVNGYQVLFEPPPKGYHKKVIVVLEPDSKDLGGGRISIGGIPVMRSISRSGYVWGLLEPHSRGWSAFPQHIQYLNVDVLPQIVSGLPYAKTETEICRFLHLIGVFGPSAQSARGFIEQFLDSINDVIASVAADVLAEIGGVEIAPKLLAVVENESRPARVREIASLALVSIGSNEAIEELYKSLPLFDFSDLVLQRAAAQANRQLIRQVLQTTIQHSEHSQTVLRIPEFQVVQRVIRLFAHIAPEKLIPTLQNELETRTEIQLQVSVLMILEGLYQRQLRENRRWASRVLRIFTRFVRSSSLTVAQQAFSALANVTRKYNLSREETNLLRAGLNSPHREVRYAAAEQLVERAGESGIRLADQAIRKESDPAMREQMSSHLKQRLISHRTHAIDDAPVHVDQQAASCALATVKTLLTLFALFGIGMGFVYLRTEVPDLCAAGVAINGLIWFVALLFFGNRPMKVIMSIVLLLTLDSLILMPVG